MDRRPLKLAFFGWVDKGSGAEQLTRKTIEGLNARGHNARLYVRVATNPGGFVYQIPYLRREIGIECLLRRLGGWNDIFFPSTWLLERDPWLRNADLWHFHNLHGHFVSLPGLSWQSRRRKIVLSPVDQYLTTGYCPYPQTCSRLTIGCGNCPQLDLPYPGIAMDSTRRLWKMKRKAIRRGKFHFLFHTKFLFDHHRSALGLREKLKHLRYGVDVNIYRPISRSECAGQQRVELPRKFVVGLFHSDVLEARKGLLPLLHGLQELSRSLPGKLEVLVVGRNSDRASSLATPEFYVSSLPFRETEAQLAQALNLCDVLLYPTRAENMSLTCLSALACGVPVISSRIGGQPEAILNGNNGFLTEVGDDKSILNAVEILLREPETRERLSENARKSAVEYFDMDVYVDRLIEYYYAEVLAAA